jgi:hypothetical protein
MPHAQDPCPVLGPSPKSGSGRTTRSLPRALLYAGYIQWPTQLSATRPLAKALPSVFGSTYVFHDWKVFIADTTAGVSRAPCALPPFSSAPPADQTIGANP